MTARVTGLWRHPVKSHGREALDSVRLSAGATMPWDRTWAVAHDAARTSGTEWATCVNFSIGSKAPGLMAINARLDEATETLTLTHPDLPDLTFQPDADPQALITWTKPLIPEGRAQSARIIRVPGRGMTDTDFPSVSIGNMASHRVLAAKLGRDLSEKRWRANIWFDGMPPWEEGDWIGRIIRIGSTEIAVREPVVRCLATTANPDTGKRDADTLGALNAAREFCVYGEVVASGDIALGDPIEVLSTWN
jgi:MOSC domain-containing protein